MPASIQALLPRPVPSDLPSATKPAESVPPTFAEVLREESANDATQATDAEVSADSAAQDRAADASSSKADGLANGNDETKADDRRDDEADAPAVPGHAAPPPPAGTIPTAPDVVPTAPTPAAPPTPPVAAEPPTSPETPAVVPTTALPEAPAPPGGPIHDRSKTPHSRVARPSRSHKQHVEDAPSPFEHPVKRTHGGAAGAPSPAAPDSPAPTALTVGASPEAAATGEAPESSTPPAGAIPVVAGFGFATNEAASAPVRGSIDGELIEAALATPRDSEGRPVIRFPESSLAPDAIGRTAASARTESTLEAASPERFERILEQLRGELQTGRNEFRLRLDPPDLGRLDVRITTHGEGVVLRLVAERNDVAQWLRTDLPILHRSVERDGLQVVGVEVRSWLDLDPRGRQDQREADQLQREESFHAQRGTRPRSVSNPVASAAAVPSAGVDLFV